MVGVALPLHTLQAQNTITITLAVSPFEKDAFSEKFVGGFEAANPGVKVQLVDAQGRIPDVSQGLDAHLTAGLSFARSLVALFLPFTTCSLLRTRRGGLLYILTF